MATRIFITAPTLIYHQPVPSPNKFLHTSITLHLRMSSIHCRDPTDAAPLCLSSHVFALLTATTIPAQDTQASDHHVSHMRSRGSTLLYLFVSFACVRIILFCLFLSQEHIILYCFIRSTLFLCLFSFSQTFTCSCCAYFMASLEGHPEGRPQCDEIRPGFGSRKGSSQLWPKSSNVNCFSIDHLS